MKSVCESLLFLFSPLFSRVILKEKQSRIGIIDNSLYTSPVPALVLSPVNEGSRIEERIEIESVIDRNRIPE